MVCFTCKEDKGPDQFYVRKDGTALRSPCKPCAIEDAYDICECGSRKTKKSGLCRPCKYKDGHITGQGYRKHGDTLDHRVVMEEAIGRNLLPQETVHHKNGNRLDNRIENLELWASRHPRGQRVEDLVEWAREILALYE